MSVFRFAPSPNGYLHLGHAYSALLNAQAAEAVGGRLLLRIEDIDPARCRPEFERAIYDDLDWLGLRFAPPIRRQSEHLAEHRAALERLQQMGLIYPSFESRADIAGVQKLDAPVKSVLLETKFSGDRAVDADTPIWKLDVK